MSFRNQLNGLLFFVISLVFIGNLWINIDNTRTYLNQQLGSHAQDTATSLGLSLVPHLADNDLATIDVLLNVIFDRGYYQQILVKTIDDKILTGRQASHAEQTVPQWFRHWFLLEAPLKISQLNSGWVGAGSLSVQSHTGLAYQQLWAASKRTLLTTSLIFLLSLLLGQLLLRQILRPLKQIEKQATAVSKRHFYQLTEQPATRELQHLGAAMNLMVSNISRSFKELSTKADNMRQEAYVDPLTGLGNRRSFNEQIQGLLEERLEYHQGYLMLVRLPSLEVINTHLGYGAGDDYLLSVATMLAQQLPDDQQQAQLFRTGGSEFMVVLHNFHQPQMAELAGHIHSQLLLMQTNAFSRGVGNFAAVRYDSGDPLRNILSELDSSLSQAVSSGTNQFLLDANQESKPMGHLEWAQVIKRLIAHASLELYKFPVEMIGRYRSYDFDISTRFQDGTGRYYGSQELFAHAERLGLMTELDKLVIEQAMSMFTSRERDDQRFGLHISAASLHCPSFRQWLDGLLSHQKTEGCNLVFKFTELAALKNIDSARLFVKMVRRHGCLTSLERFGASFNSFQFLRQLGVDFVKIDGSYIRDLPNCRENRFYITTLVQLAHSLDITFLATQVETEQEREVLQTLGVDGFQGYVFGMPTHFTNEYEVLY